MFAIVPLPEPLIAGIRTGASLGALRRRGVAQTRIDRPMADEQCGAELHLAGAMPDNGGDHAIVTVHVTNRSDVVMSSAGALPVRVGVRWRHREAQWVDAVRADLPEPPVPDGIAVVDVHVPAEVFHHVSAEATMLQEHVRWFDEIWAPASARLSLAA